MQPTTYVVSSIDLGACETNNVHISLSLCLCLCLSLSVSMAWMLFRFRNVKLHCMLRVRARLQQSVR
jgi:hypothetical protein